MSLPSPNEAIQQQQEHEAEWDPLAVVVPNSHTMQDALQRYTEPKVHQTIFERRDDLRAVIVRGSYTRQPPSIIANREKRYKPFNWHRPTATASLGSEGRTVYLNCFPGQDYVQHYAGVVATYLALTKSPAAVSYELPPVDACYKIFTASNLKELGRVDIVVVGCIYHLPSYKGNSLNEGSSDMPSPGKNIFAWQKHITARGASVALLGCMPSFWGDASSSLVRALRELCGAKVIIYLGKAGSMRPKDEPNETIATGNRSVFQSPRARTVEWVNVLQEHLHVSPRVKQGIHLNVTSPLSESLEWLQSTERSIDWVDCEVGYMATECNALGVAFGYLHIISDNVVARSSIFDLSNEHLSEVVAKRKILYAEVEKALQAFLDNWTA